MSKRLLDTDVLSDIKGKNEAVGLPIVTGNVAHFEQVSAIGYHLTVDNWKAD